MRDVSYIYKIASKYTIYTVYTITTIQCIAKILPSPALDETKTRFKGNNSTDLQL